MRFEREFGYVDIEVEGDVCYVMDVEVKKEFRGRSYGRKLVEEVIDWCKKMGLKEIRMDVWNERMVRIVEKLGFEKDGSESDVGMGYVLRVR